MTNATTYSHISIHALHEESDRGHRMEGQRPDISIHALHEESDRDHLRLHAPPSAFQSTLSMRRATHRRFGRKNEMDISIHALHEESD